MASRGGPRSNRVWSVMIRSVLRSSCVQWPVTWCGEIPHSKQFLNRRTSNEAKTIHGTSEVSDPPWHEQALLTSQSRQIRVERRWMRHFDPTTDSRREQSQARRSRSQEIDSVLQCFLSRGEFAPSNSHSLVLPSPTVLWDLWINKNRANMRRLL